MAVAFVDRGHLAMLLIKYRTRARLSQRALANLSGISQGTIRNLELGERVNPQVETLNRLSKSLAVQWDGTMSEVIQAEILRELLHAAQSDMTPSLATMNAPHPKVHGYIEAAQIEGYYTLTLTTLHGVSASVTAPAADLRELLTDLTMQLDHESSDADA